MLHQSQHPNPKKVRSSMPMYDFRCTTCTYEWTEHRVMAERDRETFCPTCTNPYIVRVYKGQQVAIIYKTDGFYSTDKGKK